MRIMIRDFINSNTAISYDDGKKCFHEILNYIDKADKIILDFKGVEFVITAFLNPVIGDLIIQKGKSVMNKIQIDNANKSIIEKISIVKRGALLKREDMVES